MGEYSHELWMGRASHHWNWHIKGVLDDDYESRIKLCDEVIEELKVIKDYYQHLILDKEKQ